MSLESENRKNFLARIGKHKEAFKWTAVGTATANFIAARQIEMTNPNGPAGADQPFIALTVFSVAVAGILEAIKRIERFDSK